MYLGRNSKNLAQSPLTNFIFYKVSDTTYNEKAWYGWDRKFHSAVEGIFQNEESMMFKIVPLLICASVEAR